MSQVKAEKKITEEKVWMKYYSEEAQNCELPRCTAYEYLQQRNAERIDEPAIHYYGKDISFRELYRRVRESGFLMTESLEPIPGIPPILPVEKAFVWRVLTAAYRGAAGDPAVGENIMLRLKVVHRRGHEITVKCALPHSGGQHGGVGQALTVGHTRQSQRGFPCAIVIVHGFLLL